MINWTDILNQIGVSHMVSARPFCYVIEQQADNIGRSIEQVG